MADERQVFVYKGVEYSLPSKLTPAEAKAKIQAHLGESTTQPQEPPKTVETPQLPSNDKRSTSLWEDIKSGAGSAANLVDLAASSLYAFPQSNENVRQIMEAYERRAKVRNQELGVPKDAVQGPVGKIVSGLAAFPASPLSGAQTTKTFKESGENNNRAATAGVTDTLAQALGLLIPGAVAASVPFRAGVGAGSNALQEVISNAVIKEIATKEDTRKKFELSIEDTVASALSGGAFGAIHGDGRKKSVPNPKLDGLKKLAEQRAAQEAANAPKPAVEPQQLELPLETSAQSIREMQTKGDPQMDLFEIANQPHERMPTIPDAVEPPAPRYGEQAALIEAQKRQRNAEQVVMLENEIQRNQRLGERTAYDRGQSTETLYGGKDGVYTPDNLLVEDILRKQDFDRTKAEAADAILADRETAIQQEMRRKVALEQAAAERARQQEASTGYEEWLANRNIEDASRSVDQLWRMNEDPNAQGHLDFNDFGNNDPMERMPNMRIDENGMPIRADISMEAANLENPLQRNLWGDELGPALDQTRSLTEAIDSMPPGEQRQAGINMLSQDVNADFSLPRNPTSGTGSPSINRFGQGGSQTILTDLGLGVYSIVTKPRETARKLLDKISAGYIKDTELATDVPIDDILNSARSTPDTKAINALEAGNTMRGYKGRAQWVHDAGEYLLNRLKRSELNIRNYVTGNTGAEKFMRSLSKNEQIELAGLLKEEMLNRRQFDPADMAAAGFNAKQLEAYAKLRKMQEAALAALNYGRKVHNLPEITAQEAYLTSKWNGEVKMRVEDSEGKLVYYLAGNSERDVKNQLAALTKEHPEYKGGKIERIKQTFNGSDVQKAYSIMADAIGRDNPEFQKVQEWYTQYQATQAHDSMGTRKHFEDKANIRGFIGDRPGYNPKTEAIALLQEQMNFAKESFHWAALQDAAVALSPIFQDPMIRDNHPNNLRYLQEQLAIAAGANEGAFSRGVNDGIRSLGFTPAQVFGGAQKAKSWFMFQKLSMNLGYGAANLLQLPFTVPHLIDIANKVGGFNPARSLAVATALGAPMAGTHYSRQLAGIDLLQNIPDKNFYKSLVDYAEQNGVTSRSIVDEAPLSAGMIGRVGNFTTSAPETVIRSFAFTLFADSLKQTGKLSDMEVFKEAERRTNAALGDFRETQRAPIFSRMGNVGNILNTLQTFGINYYQQMNYFMRESLKGNAAPLAAMLAIQFGLSGLSGMPGAQTAEKGWELIKGILPNSVWAKVGDFDPRIWAYEKFGATGVDGVLSTATGVSFNSRIGAPAIEEMAQAPGGPIMEVGKQLLSVGQLAMRPDDKVQQAETVMKLMPAGFTGALETGPFRDQTSVDRKDGRMYFKSTDLNKRDAGYVRSPEEETLRKYGFRSTKEVTTRNLEWKQTKYKQELNERRRSFSDSFFDAVMRGDTKKAAEIDANAVTVFGKSLVDNTMKNQLQQMYMTSYERAQSDASKLTPTELIRLKNIKDILDKYQ